MYDEDYENETEDEANEKDDNEDEEERGCGGREYSAEGTADDAL